MNEICKCGHHVFRHDHYRRGTDCSAEACGCPRLLQRCRPVHRAGVVPTAGRVGAVLPEDESEALRWKRVTVFNYGRTNKRGVEINVFGRWFTFAAEREEKIQ